MMKPSLEHALLIRMELIGKQSLSVVFAPASNAPVSFPSAPSAFFLLSAVQSVDYLCVTPSAANRGKSLIYSEQVVVWPFITPLFFRISFNLNVVLRMIHIVVCYIFLKSKKV